MEPINNYNCPMDQEPYQSRNYRAFAFLADVRNGFEANGSGRGIQPIAAPRGVPVDASPEWLHKVDTEWGGGMHSLSYFTLTELMEADWDQEFVQRGIIPEDLYLSLRGTDKSPQAWYAGIGGGFITTLTQEDYESMCDQNGELKARDKYQKYHVQYSWTDTVKEAASDLYEVVHTHLIKCAPFVTTPAVGTSHPSSVPSDTPRDTDKVRLVFGFDN